MMMMLSCCCYCVGYIPAPMLFGALIDSTCRLWETDSSSSSSSSQCHAVSDAGTSGGSCLLFDTDQLRWRTYGVAVVVQCLQLTFAVLLYLSIRHRDFGTADDPPPAKSTPDAANAKPNVEELTLLEVTSTQPSDGHADGAL